MEGGLRSIGRYQVVRVLGRGGFGEVLEAKDVDLARPVAIKRLLPSQDPSQRERFLREARSIAALDHPNVVRIYDVGFDGDAPYIVQELLEGQTLHRVLEEQGGALDLPVALAILIAVAEALDAAHAAGIVHRDVKPSNIYLTTDGRVKVIDFGIATMAAEASRLTVASAFIGTPAYASPEQIEGARVDARSDMFAFGAVAFEVLTGRAAFAGDSVWMTIRRIREEPVPDLAAQRPDAPDDLVELIRQCLEREPDRRPVSMKEVAERLAKIRQQTQANVVKWPVSFQLRTARAAPTPPEAAQGTMAGPVLLPVPDAPATPAAAAPLAPSRTDGGGTVVIGRFPAAAAGASARAAAPSAVPRARPDVAPGDALPPGATVGRFTVHELVAHGQTGHLYRAYDPVRSKLVGLKVIERPSGLAVQRLLRASRIWLDLTHPNLQRIYEVDPGRDGGPALIATQLLEGLDLGAMLKQNRLDLAQKIHVVLQVCEALDYLHRHGVVHREVKPRNIVLSLPNLDVTLLDSGLARSTDARETRYTVTGMIVGDMNYMAPEQLGGKFDQRSDVYSLGVVLYQMVTGAEPDLSALATARDRLAGASDLPQPLVLALRSALQPDADNRPSVREFSDMLRVLVPETPTHVDLSKVVVTLHGIRTHASWQRAFSEVAFNAGLQCRLDRWNFGHFSVLKFLAPWARTAKVGWFRSTYNQEFADLTRSVLSTERPSIVAHSFGTYVLGNALLRYPYLRFNKVLLCGSILPRDFPWDAIINRGQVQAVRNEYGARDIWTALAQKFVAGTGPSGTLGFVCRHDRLEQEAFDYAHSEYFERGHMSDRWIPFLRRTVSHITPREHPLEMPAVTTPWGLWVLYACVAAVVAGAARVLWLAAL